MSPIFAITDNQVISITVQLLMVAAKVSAPILAVSLAVGFGMSLFQSVTQLQDATLAFVPKLIGVAAVIVVSGNWMLHELVGFTVALFDLIPSLLQNN
jgi:flagellar biosynthesis protein FliQ